VVLLAVFLGEGVKVMTEDKRKELREWTAGGGRASVVGHSGTLAYDFSVFLNILTGFKFFYGNGG
jgi:hypothetical protein